MIKALVWYVLALGCLVCASCGGEDRPNILLVTLDTTRADHVGCYGKRNDITPRLDRLAREGARFENAFSTVPLTLPAHTSILTGNHPQYHGVHNNGNFSLNASAQTLAEDLQNAGYRTAAVIGAVVLDEQFGLDQGFDLYDSAILADKGANPRSERSAAEVSRLGIEWLEEENEAFFLWLHYYDPHIGYHPPAPFNQRFPNDPYAGEIAYTDACLGQVLDKLAAMDLLDNTLILVIGDHGEGLGEHREQTHGIFIYDTTMKVPFLVRFPTTIPGGQVIDPLVDITDIRPTILGLLGLPQPGEIQGRDLTPLLQGGKMKDRPILFESHYPSFNYGWSALGGLRTREWKYIHAPQPELFRIDQDPGETTNLADRNEDQRRLMAEAYGSLVASMERQGGEALSQNREMSREMEEKLKELGYTWSRNAHQGQEGKDPKEMVLLLDQITAAQALLEEGKLEGIDHLEAVISQDPDNFMAVFTLGDYFQEAGDLERAQPLLETAARLNPRQMAVHMKLGSIYQNLKEFDRAIQEYKAAMAISPDSSWPTNDLANLYNRQNNTAEAEIWYRRTLEIKPYYTTARVNLALMFLRQKRSDDAEEMFREALRHEPDSVIALVSLAASRYKQGDREEAITLIKRTLEIAPGHPRARRYLAEWTDEG